MATIDPELAIPVQGVETHKWETLTESDTAQYVTLGGSSLVAASVQIIGTFGSATVVVQGSNDATNWVTLQDFEGDDISVTAAGARDFSTAMVYVRPSASGGTGQDVDVILATRG